MHDNCPLVSNLNQEDLDGDGQGDLCDADDDDDGFSDTDEALVGTDPTNPDTDADAALDGSDNCPLTINPSQADFDTDGVGDLCDSDDDDDGVTDDSDCAPFDNTIFPGATELCDAIDSDCDGDLVESFINTDGDSEPDCIDSDDDGDGFGDSVDCAPLDSSIYPNAVELCDGIDSDCDGSLVDEFDDTDGDLEPDCTDSDDDNDGLSDSDEALAGYNSLDADSDGDGTATLARWALTPLLRSIPTPTGSSTLWTVTMMAMASTQRMRVPSIPMAMSRQLSGYRL